MTDKLDSNYRKEVKGMKKFVTVLLASMFAMSLAACAPQQEEKAQVKCPACGYEFEAPMGGN